MIKNLLLDWSGTVADDLGAVIVATNRVLAHYGRAALSREEFRATFRLPYTEFYQEVLPDAHLPDLQRLYLESFPSPEDHPVPLIEHAEAFLNHARRTGKKLVVLSSAPLDHVEEQARNNGVHGHFHHYCCGVVDKRTRILELLAEHAMNPAETAFVGDMRHDIHAGKEAGVLSIATATGYESIPTLLTAAPDVLVPNLASLTRLLGPLSA